MKSKAVRLVEALIRETNASRLLWEETSTSETYQASFPKYSVQIFSRFNSATDEEDMVISIINEEGTTVESIADTDLAGSMETPYRQMQELHETARKTALGIDDAIDSLLEQLGYNDPPS